jgi:Zn-finger nucleic acid-binding protein
MTASRPCPACRSPLETRSANGAEIDRCPGCKGYWFDAKELARAAGGPVPRIERGAPSSRPCPVCAVPLVSGTLGDVHVDSCTTCFGLWLDAGEFQVVQRAAAGAVDQADVRRVRLDADAKEKREAEQKPLFRDVDALRRLLRAARRR